jgi:hypothetical protein
MAENPLNPFPMRKSTQQGLSEERVRRLREASAYWEEEDNSQEGQAIVSWEEALKVWDEEDELEEKRLSSVAETQSERVALAKNPMGGVYLLGSGVHFKIGKANDFEQRIKQVKLQLPEKTVEIHRIYTDDPLGIESYWHRRFAAKRLNGEWFALTEEDVEVFKARERM